MSHVDEGTLHAYLDGALDTLPAAEAERVRDHLAACDVCQARLEEERAVRAEAAAILGGVTLDVGDLPSFEEVRSLVGRAPRGATPGSRLQRMAWAASVVLALGTGWLLRGGIPQPTARVEVAEPTTLPAAAASESEVDARAPGSDADARQERAKATGAEEEAAREEAAVPPANVAFGDARASDAEADMPEALADRDALVSSGVAAGRVVVDSLDVASKATVPAELWAAARQRREGLAEQLVVQPSPTASDRLAGRVSPQSLAEEARGVVSPARSTIPVRADAPTRAGVSLVVPGLSVVSVAWLEEPDLAGAVRVLQLMENGDTLELVHLPEGVEPALLPAVGDGRTQVLSPREGGWLVARARASTDVLSALLRRLEGGD